MRDSKREVKVKIKRLINSFGLPLPEYKSKDAAGFDLMSAMESVVIMPGDQCPISTGFAVEIPKGYELQVRPRSGLALKNGISIVNSPGTVDSDYRGELVVILINHGRFPFKVGFGDRIAQAVISPVVQALFEEVKELSSTERGENGFGSTGII